MLRERSARRSGHREYFIKAKFLFVGTCSSTFHRVEKPLFERKCVPVGALFREVAGSWLRQRSCWYLGHPIIASKEAEE